MTKSEFLQKCPELSDDDNVSEFKINLLKNYTTHSISKGDVKIINLLKDYDDMLKCENRDLKITYLLKERVIRRLKSKLLMKKSLV